MTQQVILKGRELYDVRDGLFLITRLDPDNWNHAMVFDSGNVLGFREADKFMLYHLPNKEAGLKTPTLKEYLDDRRKRGDPQPRFSFDLECLDIENARNRLLKVYRRNEQYHELFNNCEHFAYEIITGEKQSPQLRDHLITAGVIAVIQASQFILDRQTSRI